MDIMKGPATLSILLIILCQDVLTQNSTTKSAASTKASSTALTTGKSPLPTSIMTTSRSLTTSMKSSTSPISLTTLTKTQKRSTRFISTTPTARATRLPTVVISTVHSSTKTTAVNFTDKFPTSVTTVQFNINQTRGTIITTALETTSPPPAIISTSPTPGYSLFINSTLTPFAGSSEMITPSSKSVIIGVTCAFVILAMVVTSASLIVYFRNRNSLNKPKQPVICSSKPCSIHSFIQHAADMEKDSGLQYADEYGEELKQVGKYLSCEAADLKCNQRKNRFTNIKPYDISRVKLLPIDGDDDGSDYINASWMPGHYSRREYITTQGPLPWTRDDFWRMVWEYSCKGIVMLTSCVEKEKIKCDHYWPIDLNPVVYGDLEVKIIKEDICTDWVIRDMQIFMGQQVKYVKHLQYIAWCDMSVPDNPESLLEFVEIARRQLSNTWSGLRPTVVHCSAGVGRSGTFIALDTLLHELHEKASVDVYGVVYRLRMNRTSMVQTESQYMFLHTCIAAVIQRQNHGEINVAFNEDEFDDTSSMQTFRTFDSQIMQTFLHKDLYTTLVLADIN